METKKKAGMFKNLAIISCVAYLFVNYMLKETYLSLSFAITAMIFVILALLSFRKAKREKYMNETYRKPKIRRR